MELLFLGAFGNYAVAVDNFHNLSSKKMIKHPQLYAKGAVMHGSTLNIHSNAL